MKKTTILIAFLFAPVIAEAQTEQFPELVSGLNTEQFNFSTNANRDANKWTSAHKEDLAFAVYFDKNNPEMSAENINFVLSEIRNKATAHASVDHVEFYLQHEDGREGMMFDISHRGRVAEGSPFHLGSIILGIGPTVRQKEFENNNPLISPN